MSTVDAIKRFPSVVRMLRSKAKNFKLLTFLFVQWGPAIRSTDTAVYSLIRTFEVSTDSESCRGGPGNSTSTDTGTLVYKYLQDNLRIVNQNSGTYHTLYFHFSRGLAVRNVCNVSKTP